MGKSNGTVDPATAELVGYVYQFLVDAGFSSSAKAVAKETKLNPSSLDLKKGKLSTIFGAFKAPVAESSTSDSSDSSSSESESSDSEDEAPAKKPAPVKAAPKADSSSDSDSSSSSDSSDSEDEAPAKPAAKVVAKKDSSSSSSDDSSSSDSSDSEDEAPAKPAAKAAAKPAATSSSSSSSSSESSSSSSSESSDSEDEAPVINNKRKADAVTPAPKKVKTNDGLATPASATSSSGESHTIFVKGLPWRTTDAEVSEYFASCGSIVSVELPIGDDGRSTGTAVVKFSSRAELDAALAMDGSTWPGTERWLKITEGYEKTPRKSFVPGEKPEGCDTVFVGNLPWDVEEEQLRELFSQCGEVNHIRFATSPEDGSFKGFGHVQFADGASTDAAVQLAGTEVNGRAIRVDYAPPRNRDSLGGGGRGGGRGRGGAGRGGGRGRGRGGGSLTPGSKNKGTIVAGTGNKISFD